VEVTGPGLFENGNALALLGQLAERDPTGRREILVMILRHRAERGMDDEAWLEGPVRIVAAVGVVAAGLAPGEAIAGQIAAVGYNPAEVTAAEDPALADDALAALLVVAGRDLRAPRDGAWHYGWPDPETALRARAATDGLAAVFRSYQHRYDQELPMVCRSWHWERARSPLFRCRHAQCKLLVNAGSRSGVLLTAAERFPQRWFGGVIEP
jgi:hypothetical protein